MITDVQIADNGVNVTLADGAGKANITAADFSVTEGYTVYVAASDDTATVYLVSDSAGTYTAYTIEVTAASSDEGA